MPRLGPTTDSPAVVPDEAEPAPGHPLDLPWDPMPDDRAPPRDRAAQPSLEQVLALRGDRMAGGRAFLVGLTEESLAADTVPVDAPGGWPPPVSHPVRSCLLTLLNEEWEHRRFAERDLAVLEARAAPAGTGHDGGAPLP